METISESSSLPDRGVAGSAGAARRETRHATDWAALSGRWEFDSPHARFSPQGGKATFGTALSNLRLRNGSIASTIVLREPLAAARIVFGHEIASQRQFYAGIGGTGAAYTLDEVSNPGGLTSISKSGDHENLEVGRPYALEVSINGQNVWLDVDGIRVLAAKLPTALLGDQVGVMARSAQPVDFQDLRVVSDQPRAFIVMEFGRYDALNQEVVTPTCEALGVRARRADDIHAPGVVLADIIEALIEADVVIAEVTPANANVYYEVGYAHAVGKPTILLAERGTRLPFDIGGYRCIFYEDSIGGKRTLEDELTRHLESILVT